MRGWKGRGERVNKGETLLSKVPSSRSACSITRHDVTFLSDRRWCEEGSLSQRHRPLSHDFLPLALQQLDRVVKASASNDQEAIRADGDPPSR